MHIVRTVPSKVGHLAVRPIDFIAISLFFCSAPDR